MGDIRRYFQSLVSAPIPLQISRSYMVNSAQKLIKEQLTAIGNDLAAAWQDGTSLDWWITCVFSLAITLPAILGFAQTLFVIDHIEVAQTQLFPNGRFVRSGPCDIGEHLKYLIRRGDYIFACERESRLLDFMSPIDDEGVDLFKRTDFLTTYGIAKGVTDFDPAIILQIKDNPRVFVMKGSYLDGIPNYISIWNDIHVLLDDVDCLAPGSDEQLDARFRAIAHAQALMELLYLPEDRMNARVVNLRRSSRREGVDLKAEEERNRKAQEEDLESAYSTSVTSTVDSHAS
jgi:hypothetical protein